MTWVVLHRDEAGAVGRRAREAIAREYDIRASVRAYEDLYERLLS